MRRKKTANSAANRIAAAAAAAVPELSGRMSRGVEELRKLVVHRGAASVARVAGRLVSGLPLMMSTKCSDFLTPSPLSAFGSDLNYKIHATSLTMSAFP